MSRDQNEFAGLGIFRVIYGAQLALSKKYLELGHQDSVMGSLLGGRPSNPLGFTQGGFDTMSSLKTEKAWCKDRRPLPSREQITPTDDLLGSVRA